MGKYVLEFGEPGSDDREVVGGKAASLGRLSANGFPVPPGFTVRTDAYLDFLTASDLRGRLEKLVGALDYDNAGALEKGTAEIRSLIVGAQLPDEVAEAIASEYRAQIGESADVAVRSSGTAEDMAEASFAGLHDTYLNIVGVDEVLTAVRKCWASMWTARATAYRTQNGLDHLSAAIAVVVQKMVDAEIAGVMFTANPLTARVDELVVNAAWGLGEGVVSGVLTPDEYRIDRDDLTIRGKTLGTKAVKVVRDPESGIGTVTVDTPAADQNAFSLDDKQIAELADLGRRVEAFYEGIPQDTEWAYAHDTFYLLQSRDITGVDFTWDEDIDATTWPNRRDDPEVVWSQTWAEQFWTGAITPLFYSVRGAEWNRNWDRLEKLWGFDDELSAKPWFKYRRGTAYWNLENDNKLLINLFPKSLRAAALTVHNPPQLQAEPAAAPFDLLKFIKMQARVHITEPDRGALSWFDYVYNYIDNRTDEVSPTVEELRTLSDRELRRRAAHYIAIAEDFCDILWTGFFVYGAGSMYLLGDRLAKWYRGDNPDVFADLVSGLPTTRMAAEQHAMWDLAAKIRDSEDLRPLLQLSTPTEFFARLEDSQDGKAFRADYEEYLAEYGHRGHADRDVYYKRRMEDPSLDYNSFRALLTADGSVHPKEQEAAAQKNRQKTLDEVVENIRRQPFGGLKAEAMKWLADYVVRFLKLRDDERWYIDKVTFSKKLAFDEMGRRLVEKGVLERDDDHYFLSQHELYQLVDGAKPTRLTRLKINNRREVFESFLRRDEVAPRYMKDGAALDFDADSGDGLRGVGTSRGLATGRARIVPNLSDIGRVEKGDILICNATDPGWAPVFMIIKGLVLETGGMLAHGACLSREYGLPAVQIAGAMRRIEDGAMISVNGATGEVIVLDGEDAPAEAEAEETKELVSAV
jgi:phosphoenolpyruvate synthase/pyruvate phosphate dikinase